MRKPRGGLVVAVGMIAALAMGSSTLGATSLPVFEDFESLSTGQDMHTVAHWSTNGASDASAAVQTTNVISGSRGCATSMAGLTLAIDAAQNATNVWVQVYTKPTLYDNSGGDPTLLSDTVLSFFVNLDGDVRANNGAVWTTVGTVTTGGALAFAVHADFDAGRRAYDLFASDDGAVGSSMKKLNNTPLAFNPAASSATKLTEFVVEGKAVLDAVAAAKDIAPVTGVTPSNVLVIAKNLTGGLNEDVSLQGHTYALLADTAFDGALGDDLLRAIDTGDTVKLRDGATTEVFIENPADTWQTTADPSTTYVIPGTALWVYKTSSGPFVVFSDYNTLTLFDKPVYGTTGSPGGLNRLAWDKPDQSLAANAGAFGFSTIAQDGDWLYLGQNGGTLLRWQGGAWRDGAGVAVQTLSPGETFWYVRRLTEGPANWPISTAQ